VPFPTTMIELREFLRTTDISSVTFDDIGISWASCIVELLFAELSGLRESSDNQYHQTCLQWLRRLSRQYDIIPSSICLHNIRRNGKAPVGGARETFVGTMDSALVCLKILPVRRGYDGSRLPGFAENIILSRFLDHPNLQPLLGINMDLFTPYPCIVSPWVSNGNVLQYLHSHPTCNRLSLIMQTASGIQYLHKFMPTIIHGDIRPVNILVKDDGSCYLTDFRSIHIPELNIGGADRPYFLLGWAAPEIHPFSGAKLLSPAPSTDVYAFGCTMFAICTGYKPFRNSWENPGVRQRPNRPSGIWLPDELRRIIELCWIEDPSERPDINAVIEMLGAVPPLEGGTSESEQD